MLYNKGFLDRLCMILLGSMFFAANISAKTVTEVSKGALVSSIEGTVWIDADGNGVQDVSEVGLSSVGVHLFDSSDTELLATTTNASGDYTFAISTDDNYYIKFDLPTGYSFTLENFGVDDTIDSEVNGSNGPGTTSLITTTDGNTYSDINAGIYICVPIGDLIWYDTDLDDIFDSNENGINGMVVNLWRKSTDTTFVKYATTTTASFPNSPSDDGYYKFCAPPGTYYVEVAIPPNFGLVSAVPNVGSNEEIDSDTTGKNGPNTTDLITVVSGDQVCDLGHGLYPKAKLGDRAWIDINGNGIQDGPDRNLVGAIVRIYDALTGVEVQDSIITGEDGMYCFDNLGKGCYYLGYTVPAEFSATAIKVGNDDTKDNDVNGTYGEFTTGKYIINPGDINLDVDGGFYSELLPITWSEISVSNKVSYNLLKWKTIGSIDNVVFEVQKRHESEQQFSSLQTIDAKDAEFENEYLRYKDFNIYKTGIHYYRIKQMNQDGSIFYSDVVQSLVDKELELVAFPNPVNGILNLDMRSLGTEAITIEFYDANAKVVYRQVMENITNIIQINVSDFPTGIYTLKTSNDSRYLSKRIFVVR